MNFYYFVPGDPEDLVARSDKQVSPAKLREWGLEHAIGDATEITEEVILQRFTDSGNHFKSPGILFYVKPGGQVPKDFMPPDMEWVKAKTFWIGWSRNNLPTPEDLQRDRVYPGYQLADEHDNEWAIPIIRSPREERGSLPVSFGFDLETGKIVQNIKQSLEPLWDMSGEIVERCITKPEDQPLPDLDWQVSKALKVFQCNYRITREGIEILRRSGCDIFDSERITMILLMACDWLLIAEYQKKREQVTESITDQDSTRHSAGLEDDYPDTIQVVGS